MLFDDLYELCLNDYCIQESCLSFDNLYTLCLEKKKVIDFDTLKSERQKILNDYDNEILSLKEKDKQDIESTNLLEKFPEKYSNEYDAFFSLKNDINEVYYAKRKNSNNWEIESKDGVKQTAMSEDDASVISYKMLEKTYDDIKAKTKNALI